MTISILQLSDIHIKKENNTIGEKVDKIFDAIKNEIEDSKYLFIVFTGDIAYSGQEVEYQEAKKIIDTLQDAILLYKDKINIEFIFTPGNHDCDFSENGEIRDIIIDTILKNPKQISQTTIAKCTDIQKAYFEFTKMFVTDNAVHKDSSNKLLTRYMYSLGEYKVVFNSFNLAWMSKKEEKQSEIIYPIDDIKQGIRPIDECNITISLFHHPLHWLQHQSIRPFKEFINSTSDIVLTGHEHTHSIKEEKMFNAKEYIEYIEAGALQDSRHSNRSSFNFIHLDLQSNTQDIIEFQWKDDMYIKKNEHYDVTLPSSQKSVFNFKIDYEKKLNVMGLKVTHPSKEDMVLEDIFIYPDLQIINHDIKNKDNFLEDNTERFKSLKNVNHTILYGAETSGKTSLSRILQLKYKRDGLVPIIIQGKDIKSNDFDTNKIKKLIIKSFKSQYLYDSSILTQFEQTDKNQLVLMIDDFQNAKLNGEHKAKFIEVIMDLNYPNILLFAHDSLLLEATTEGVLAKSLIDFKHYKILEFGHKIREKLIKKWVLLGRESSFEKKDLILKIREKATTIDTTVGYNLVPAYPFYLLTLLQAMEANETNSLSKSSYGHYYEFLIMRYLNANHPMNPKDINTIFTYTSTLAFHCLSEKQYCFTREELRSFDNDYCERKRFTPSFDIVEKLVKSNILSVYEGEYKFSYDYIYYFFVAKYLADHINEPDVQDMIKKMCQRLYRTEFANITMFLIHHSTQPFILEAIIKEAKQVFEQVEAFSFAPEELIKINTSIKNEKIILKDRTLGESRDIELEKKDTKQKIKSIHSVGDRDEADYDEEVQELSQFSTLNLAFKMIEILGEITKNYSGSLDGNIKVNLIKETYGIGLRSLKSLVEFFENNHELLSQEIAEMISKKGYVTGDKVNELVANMIFSMVSSISTGIVQRIAKSIASKDLNTIYKEILEEDSENIAIQLINHTINLDFQGGLNVAKAEKKHTEFEVNNNRLADSVLKKTVLEHIYMFDIDFDKKQSVCAKLGIGNENSKKEMIKQIR